MIIKKYLPAINVIVLTIVATLGLFLMSAYRNSYHAEPDFFYFEVVVYSLPVLALISSLVYYQQIGAKKFAAYYWLNAAILLDIAYYIWQIYERKTYFHYFTPYDFIAGNNIYGYALGIYNFIMLLPLIVFLIGAVLSYIFSKFKQDYFNNLKVFSIVILASLAAAYLLRFGLLKIIYGSWHAGALSSHSAVVASFGRVYSDEAATGELMDVTVYNTSYSYNDISVIFGVDANTKFLDKNGRSIDKTSIAGNTMVKISYDARNQDQVFAKVVRVLP